ncbi:MAG: YjbE family putative metal transport protein [Acidobacteriia bacterium]|nr:YjbE family putative metal transport protein [Terriglobia bacterium]
MSPGHFLVSACAIILIDLLLAGDNALVIAMAVRALPAGQRRMATACGAAAAVALRVALTSVATRLLTIPYVQLAGGGFIVWIALKVLADAGDPPDAAPAPRRMAQAIWYIVLADLTMSTDNILAIAGASHGHIGLVIFGLALSIPFVVFAANLLAALMDRVPALGYAAAAILGKVGGEMILTDPFVMRMEHPSVGVRYGLEAALAVAVVIGGRWMGLARARRAAAG